MHFTCRSFIGKSEVGNWSQYWENEPDDPQLKLTKGHLFGLINLSVADGEDITTIGHDIIFEINQSYFSGDHSNPAVNLKNTLETITSNPLYHQHQLHITLLIVIDSQIFLANFGNNCVFINRANQISQILSGQIGEISAVNGPVSPEDKIFIITQEFLEKITKDTLKSTLADSKIQNIEENLLSLLYSFDNQNNLSAALIQVHSDIEDPATITSQNEESPSPSVFPNPTLDSEKPVFISHHQVGEISRRKKIQIIVALFLIIGLFISSYFGFRKNQKTKIESQYQNLKTDIEKRLNNISIVKSLNINTAQQDAKEAQKLIQQIADLKIHPDEVSNFQNQINLILVQTGASDNFSPQNVYDTSLIINNPQYNHLFLSGNSLYLLDSNQGRIDVLNINEKSNKNISISDKIKSAQKIAVDKDNVYLLTQDNISLASKTDITPKIIFSESDPVPNPVDFKFWNGSAYVLDATAATIWKYTPSASGFSKSQNWLKNDTKIDSKNISLAIDGRVWLLTQSGQVSVYISGVKDNFKTNQTSQFNQTNFLTTSDSGEYIAFVDNQNLVYLYKKTGELVSKYNLNQLKVSDIALDGANKIIYLLGLDQKIYKISL